MKSIISVEKTLEHIFYMLPAMRYENEGEFYNPHFVTGTEQELNRFLLEAKSNENKPYPLIWLLMPYSENHKSKSVKVEDLCLVIAVNGSKSLSFQNRLLTSFDKVLTPLLINIRWALYHSSVINLEEEMRVIKFPNYSVENSDNRESASIEIWDAYKVYFGLEINSGCIKQLKFPSIENQEEGPILSDFITDGSNIITT